MRARRNGGVSRHAGNAACAAFTAVSTSAWLHSGTFAVITPVAGFVMSPMRVLLAVAGLLLTHSGMFLTI